MSTKNLFLLSFIGIILVYLYVFGIHKTIQIITNEYLLIILLTIISISLGFLKYKLKDYKIIKFIENNLSLKTTIVFFIIFQVIDYISEDGFKGMLSQWFLYWVMGLIAFVCIETFNYYKNYQFIFKKNLNLKKK